ncbi:hypothetical protein V2G26_013318 [Clonostachys chloroleuca]
MNNYLTSVNTMLDYGLAVQQLIKKRWPRATFTWIDMHSLVMDRIASAEESFMWFDELHPSQRVHEYLADEFI